jgi:peptidoglycan hydrolase-like protein with peptidoglycan-binding domain
MTRKRAQPDRRRKKKKRKSLIVRCLRIVGALIGRYPSVAGGTAAFLVIFSFVAANAIWYQPGNHPAPFFRTRDRAPAPVEAAVVRTGRPSAQKQTVDELLAALPGDPAAGSDRDASATASIPVPQEPARTEDDGSALVGKIQQALADRQFYAGPVDGRMGQATMAAIQAFQAATGAPLTGEASPELLASIEATSRNAVAIPRSRPGDWTPSEDSEVARIISASVPASVPMPVPAPEPAKAAPPKLVARIQTGLRNIAYSDVAVDGIAGEKTKAAIRNFEQNYRLPVTGEPSQRVLDKLIAIGAL